MISRKEYAQRQDAVFGQMPPNSVAIVLSASEMVRNRDVHFPFRQHSDFLYLIGFNEPDSAIVFIKNDIGSQMWFFCQDKDPAKEQWEGKRLGPQAAVAHLEVEQAYSYSLFVEKVTALVETADVAFVNKEVPAPFLTEFSEKIQPLSSIVHPLRQIKSEAEIALMQQAAQISVNAHRAAMDACRVGRHEYSLQAALEHSCCWQGAREVAYPSIVASGANATTLHYVSNDQVINDGDLILIDAGAEVAGYAADITRTFPANGHFSPEQKQIYELVLASQLAGIDAVKPGNTFVDIQAAIYEVLVTGLVDLGILKGKSKKLIETKAYLPYTVHGSGHWLGLDVHDVGDYFLDEEKSKPVPLQVGMVLTVEPGLYFRAEDETVAARYRGIGVRIEDDVLVTKGGNQVLTGSLEKTVEDLEKRMQFN